jgi:hypothetical protein
VAANRRWFDLCKLVKKSLVLPTKAGAGCTNARSACDLNQPKVHCMRGIWRYCPSNRRNA